MFKKFYILALILSFPLTAMAAEDEELYPDSPPANAAFVRVINISDSPINDVTLSGIALDELTAKTASDYAVLTEDDAIIKIEDKILNHTLTAGNYYSVAMNDGDLIILNDQKIENPSKAVIALYNLSDIEKISLTSTTHNADIFKDIESGQKNARDINAVSIGVAIKNGDNTIKDIPDLKLERQISTSLFLIGENGNYDAIVKNSKNLK